MLNQTSHITGDYWDRSARHHRLNTTDQIQRSFSPRNSEQHQFPPTTTDLRQHLDQQRQQQQIQQQQQRMGTNTSTSGPQPARTEDWTTLGPHPTGQLDVRMKVTGFGREDRINNVNNYFHCVVL